MPAGGKTNRKRSSVSGDNPPGHRIEGQADCVTDCSSDDSSSLLAELNEAKSELRAAQKSVDRCTRGMQELVLKAQSAERSRLAQMLHDGLQQLLVAANMRMELLIRTLPAGTGQESAAEARKLLSQAIHASRTLTLDLSPAQSASEDLGAALVWLSNWFVSHHGLKVTVDVATNAEPESESVRALLFHGVREILFNAVKHAGVDQVQVRMIRVGTSVQVFIEDHGVGFDPATLNGSMEHTGLRTVKQRLQSAGGAMEVVSAPGAGTRVMLGVPALI